MSRFYGVVAGSAKTKATRRGHRGIETIAATWNGCIRVRVWVDAAGVERFTVYQERWEGAGIVEHIGSGVVGRSELLSLAAD